MLKREAINTIRAKVVPTMLVVLDGAPSKKGQLEERFAGESVRRHRGSLERFIIKNNCLKSKPDISDCGGVQYLSCNDDECSAGVKSVTT